MHVIIIETVIKFVCFLVMSLNSLFNTYQVQKENIGINNIDKIKSSSIVNTIQKYDTVVKYNSQVPSGVTNVITEGQDGIAYTDGNGNIYKTLKEKIDKVVEVGVGKYGSYTGIVTAYGPDCATCDGRGIVACKTKAGKCYSINTQGNYYKDDQFGDLQILAADWREFPCGTVIEITNKNLGTPILGIVMDTGYSMRKAYDNGSIHIDVAFKTEANLKFATNKQTNFSVKRWGW